MIRGERKDNFLSAYSKSVDIPASKTLLDMEAKAGNVTMKTEADRSQKMVLKLYTAIPNAFAVVFPDKSLCLKHCGLIKLKNFTVEPEGDFDFVLTLKHSEGGKSLLFTACSTDDRNSWISVFRNISSNSQSGKLKRKCRKSRGLPSLEEVSEEKEKLEEAEQIEENKNTVKTTNTKDLGERRRKRRVVETPSLEQISEEEEEDEEELSFSSYSSAWRRPSQSETDLSKAKDNVRRTGSSYRSL